MKKFFAIFAAAVMVVACASSCKKVSKTLAGTEWVALETNKDFLGYHVAAYTISFDKTSFTVTASDGSISLSGTGTYSYAYPKVRLEMPDPEDTSFKWDADATVSADYKTMIIDQGPTFVRAK